MKLFADTSYFVALVNGRDEHHQAAQQLAAQLRCKLVLTEYVILELGNLLSRQQDRPVFVALHNRLRRDADVTIISGSTALFSAGYDLYSQRADKEWSLTDCISFVVMNEHGLREALSADHHFEQAGFRALLIQSG